MLIGPSESFKCLPSMRSRWCQRKSLRMCFRPYSSCTLGRLLLSVVISNNSIPLNRKLAKSRQLHKSYGEKTSTNAVFNFLEQHRGAANNILVRSLPLKFSRISLLLGSRKISFKHKATFSGDSKFLLSFTTTSGKLLTATDIEGTFVSL